MMLDAQQMAAMTAMYPMMKQAMGRMTTEGEKLDGWLTEAESSEAEVMRKFAAGLEKDLPAVRAELTESWSTGPVEGFITKLKLLKRQGYGRANFDLLRARALAA
jgi:transposase